MTLTFYIALLISAVHSYTPAPRWGQATSLVSSSLFVQGGKQDPFNSQSYTAAPAFGDMLLLPLAQSFSVNDPPWALVSDPNNASTSPGPAAAWHTLSAVNTSSLLLFGGLPNPVVPSLTSADSGWLVNIFNRTLPQFTHELTWATEPIRRIYHAAVTAITGEVYLFGGEKADGSLLIFSDHYAFNPYTSTFTLLPTDNAPPALTGHAAVILPNGQILVFGGLGPDGLLSLSLIWIFDTKANTWSLQTASTTSDSPGGRRGFAYVLIDDNTILIHGGCDGSFQNTYSDGWTYSINTTTWTRVFPLDELGQRKDHFAASYGGQVIFGFGYGQNGPANATLSVFDPTSQTFQPSFTPPPPTASVTPTIPLPSATTATSTPTDSGTATGSVHPTSTNGGGDGGGSNAGGSGGGGGGGDDDPTKKPEGSVSRTSVIAIGAVLGLLALVSAGLGAVWYMRRQQRRRWAEGSVGGVFSPLNDEEGGAGGMPSAARMYDSAPQEKGLVGGAVESVGAALSSGGAWLAGALGLAGVVGAGAAAMERDKHRRDMLADEDTRDFGYGWDDEEDSRSNRLGRFRQGSGGSTWSLMSVFRPNPRRQGSAASGLSFGSHQNRGASLLGHAEATSEKDPFRDDVYRDVATAGAVAGATRPRAGRQQSSYASANTSESNYVDPFADPISERDIAGPGALLTALHHTRGGPLSPVTEVSRSSASQSGSSHDHQVLSPFESISRSSFGFSSNSHHSPALPPGASPAVSPAPGAVSPPSSFSGRPRTMSIVDQPTQPDQPIRRSDTWWARFASKSLLDRRSSGRASGSAVAAPDIRDPNPMPQRLGFVKEETSSVLRERSDGSNTSARAGPSAVLYGKPGHGKSMSSLQTQRTADSAAIERMGGNVDVMLRGNRQSGSTSTRASVTTRGESGDDGVRNSWYPDDEDDDAIHTSPIDMVPASAFGLPTSPPPRHPSPPRPPLSTSSSGSSGAGAVSGRIRDYERRMSQDVAPPSPTNTKQREERPRKKTHGNYGLVPRASLFVANPGNRQGSGDS